jgi:hypothetical protein
MKYDIPLKTVLKNSRSNLRAALGIRGECRDLPTNFPAREHDGDFLALVKDGRRRPYLAHLEVQKDRHPDMLSRMLGYRSDIRAWQKMTGDEECRDLHIHQTLVYIGPGSWKAKLLLKEPQIRFRFAYQDVKTLDSDVLFASDNADDAALAVLFRNGHERDMIQKIVRRIAEVSKSDEQTIEAGALLSLFSQLREAGQTAAEEWKKMNFSVDLNDSPLLKEGIDRARAESLGNLIAKQLQQKFADAVPSDIKQRLAGLNIEELDAIGGRIIQANSIEEALTVPSPSTAPRTI